MFCCAYRGAGPAAATANTGHIRVVKRAVGVHTVVKPWAHAAPWGHVRPACVRDSTALG